MHEQQRRRTTELLKSRNVDRALFADPNSVTWLTGFAPPIQLGGHHFAGGPPLLWYEDGHFTLIVLDWLAEDAGAFDAQPDATLLTYPGYTIEQPITSPENLSGVLLEVVRRSVSGSANVRGTDLAAPAAKQEVTSSGARPPGRIGIEKYALTTHLFEAVTGVVGTDVVAIDWWLVPLRMVKTEEEIAKLRRNFELTDLGHRVAREKTRPGRREIDVWTAVHGAINQEVGRRVPLGNDCIVGYREGNNIGGWPLDYEIKDDTELVIDLSTAYQGYWSDSCDVYYATEPNEKQLAMRRVVQDALDYAISLVRPGVVAKDLDRNVRQFIERAGYPVYPHHTGHGVGVSVHEEPRIVPYNDVALEEGMVIMLEPGIYFPGENSVRLEHGLLVTSDGAEILTTHIERL